MFAPTLFVGAMLGASVGSAERIFLPHLTGSIGSYALVGMGVLFAAFLRAPFTSVFMVLEVSGNYSIILPVILANTIAYLISRILQPVPIFELFTHQDGLYLPSMEEQREESDLRVEDALQPASVPILSGMDTIWSTRQALETNELALTSPAVLIQCSGSTWYAANRDQITQIISEIKNQDDPGASALLQERLSIERTPLIFPDQPLSNALPYFGRCGRSFRFRIVPVERSWRRHNLAGQCVESGIRKQTSGRW